MAEAGTGQAAELSSGISQALITTATGLLIAIPTLVSYNFYQAKVDAMVTDIERETLRVLRGLYDDREEVREPRLDTAAGAVAAD